MQPLLFFACVAVPVSIYILTFLNEVKRRKHDKRQFPGPTLLPFIGRVHDLVSLTIQYMWTKFQEWAHIYGPIYYTEMLGTKFIIVSDEGIAADLLIKRAKTNSDRPKVPSLFDPKNEYLPLMGRNKYWARQRKFTHSYLTQGHNAQYYGLMEYECKRYLYRLLTDEKNFMFALEDMAAKVMTSLLWDDHTHSVELTPSAWGLLTQMSPAGPITNVITPLWNYLPRVINPWKRAEIIRHDVQEAWWLKRLQEVRQQMELGIARPSFTRQYLESEKTSSLDGDTEASKALGMMALVGVFTVAGPLYYFLLSMIHHPLVQQKAQEEIDTVLEGKAPTLSDMPKLPYLRAVICEVMRWKPNVPTGVAHEVEADQEYNGCFIEKGTRILPLDIAFLRNPVKYPDPENFRPERWVEKGWPTYQEPLTQYPNVRTLTSFGWGHRQCLGMSVTQDELFVACGNVLWGFNLKKKIDPKTGLELDAPLDKSNSLLIIKPDPWEMAFHPRSHEKARKILTDWVDVEYEAIQAKEEFVRENSRKNSPMSESPQTPSTPVG
ncbi:cytochrome P450 [Myriangium duriaei CBS 260.36]|uniref:Cytochrome P450 n=1 Tax=Myriangium duriaei CBS 260.36 TaxID=1168546 RepID=A0A9P4MIT7_9PEZI|nr:cytochrome P450 [Myriangium duriaei CBS 260.36]